jgi:bacteriocin-like protein
VVRFVARVTQITVTMNRPAYSSDTAGGNDPVPRQKGNAMTDLNNEVRKLPIEEMTNNDLDSVSGGFNLIVTLNNILAAINFEKYVQSFRAHPVIGTTLN